MVKHLMKSLNMKHLIVIYFKYLIYKHENYDNLMMMYTK
uniref:Uncharacterized protein n=1 Tax=Schistosoma mansoni TaxID=6183 RepID=A0A3Q0KMQ2_SCHMA